MLMISIGWCSGGEVWFQNFQRIGDSVVFKEIIVGSSVATGHAAYFAPGTQVGDGAQVGGLTYVLADRALEANRSYVGAQALKLGGQERRRRRFSEQERKKQAAADFRRMSFRSAGLSATDIERAVQLEKSQNRWKAGIGALSLFLQCIVAPVIFGSLLAPPVFGFEYLQSTQSFEVAVACLPLLLAVSLFTAIGAMLLIKRVLIGRFIGVLNHWSLKTQAICSLGIFWELAHVLLLSWISGTQLYVWVLRTMGATIGKRVFFDAAAPLELDALKVGDGAVLDACLFEPHSVDNGKLQFAEIVVHSNATVGSRSILSALTRVEASVTILPGTYILKGDVVQHNTSWIGNPPCFTTLPTWPDHNASTEPPQTAIKIQDASWNRQSIFTV
jgi:acetyltransferase-like isoleucine patch superfamily enzyme